MDAPDTATPSTSDASTASPGNTGWGSRIASAFGWLVCALAAGALSAFATILTGIHPCWWMLIFALPLTLLLKACGCLQPRSAAWVAGLAILLAGFYAECLFANARVAAATGFPFGEAFRTGGIGLTLIVARFGLRWPEAGVYLVAIAIAALFAAWLARGPRSSIQ